MADELLESLDGIPEFLHSQFAKVEVDGAERYKHQAPVKTERDVAKLNDALRKERERAKALATQVEQRSGKVTIGEQEYELDEIAPIVEAHRSRQGAETITVAEATKRENDRIAKVKAALEKERDDFKAQVADRDAQLDRALLYTGISNAATSSDAPVRFLEDAIEDVQEFVVSRKMARRVGDRIEFYEPGGEVPLTNAKGEPGTFADVLAFVSSKRPHWVKASQGANSQPHMNGATSKKKRSEMNRSEKIAYLSKFGEAAYAALPD